jgi:hypothetical protein
MIYFICKIENRFPLNKSNPLYDGQNVLGVRIIRRMHPFLQKETGPRDKGQALPINLLYFWHDSW